MSLSIYARSFFLGATAGLRTTAPAFALRRSANAGTVLFGLSALGEVIADKLPGIPSRVSAGPLAGRAASGAVAGAIVAKRAASCRFLGALLGGAGAVAATYAAYHLRKAIVERELLPDTAVALMEDAAALSAAFWLSRSIESE